ncbi:MAG: hypothetical protein JST92_16685 [Deltaproteobacteria bacterium]|nr:hypothetical protein [Deltaproteobacteria bacterium]
MPFTLPPPLLEKLRARRDAQRATKRTLGPDTQPAAPRTIDPRDLPAIKALALHMVETRDAQQRAFEDAHDAFLLDPGMGPMTYLTSDGRILSDESTWFGEGVEEKTSTEANMVIVVGARKTGLEDLLELLPKKPEGARTCDRCEGTRWMPQGKGQVVCAVCGGKGFRAALVP